MSEANRALKNLVLLAHAEIRALREVIGLMMPPVSGGAPLNAGNWAEVEAECRRKHLEALGLPLDQFESLIGASVLEKIAPEPADLPAFAPPAEGDLS